VDTTLSLSWTRESPASTRGASLYGPRDQEQSATEAPRPRGTFETDLCSASGSCGPHELLLRPARDVGLKDMHQSTTGGGGGAEGVGRSDRPLGRGLEHVSHLFLSQKAVEAGASDPAASRSTECSSPPPGFGGGIALLRPASVTRDRLAIILREVAGALEEGLRAIDTKIPCHPCGEIDLFAISRGSQFTIIDFDTAINDGLLLRGIGHFDWVVRNMPNVRRMYREQAINFSLQPRLFLLAPQFSPLFRCVARQIICPQIQWVRYHTVEASGGAGILFERFVGE